MSTNTFDDLTAPVGPSGRRYEQILRGHRLTLMLQRSTGAPSIEDMTGRAAEAFSGALPDTLWRPEGGDEAAHG